jgi:hypothetical protein
MASFLTELDERKHELERGNPGWQIWYVPHTNRTVTWCARPWPLLNAVSRCSAPSPGGPAAGAAPRSASSASSKRGRRSRTPPVWPERRSCPPQVDLWGWRARFRLARGQTIRDVIAKVPAIESGLGTFRGAVRVYPTPDDLADRCELRVLDVDPHADAIVWPGPSVTSVTEPIDLGPFEDAVPCRVLFLRRHALLGGATGAGESGALNVLMGNLVACTDVVIWATTPDEARALLADAVAILEARAAMLATHGHRVWEPSPDLPALIIIIDEYAELADDAPDAIKHADSIARRGRAVAVSLTAATQRPTQKAMGQGAVRSQMDVRICFRVRERKDVDLILGQGMLIAGWNAHTLNAPGKFLGCAATDDLDGDYAGFDNGRARRMASFAYARREVVVPAGAARAQAPCASAIRRHGLSP